MVPPQLAAAAGPLREAATVLDEVADQGRGLVNLLATVPSTELRDAVRECLRAYELATWELAEETGWLAQRLSQAAGHYARLETALAGRRPHLTPRIDMPPLRDGVVGPRAPEPRPAPAPAAPR